MKSLSIYTKLNYSTGFTNRSSRANNLLLVPCTAAIKDTSIKAGYHIFLAAALARNEINDGEFSNDTYDEDGGRAIVELPDKMQSGLCVH